MLHFYSERRRQVYDDPQLAAVRAQAHLQADAASLAEQNLTVFKRRESISNYDTQRTLLLHRRDSTVGDLADTRAAIAAENARLTVLDANLRADPPAVLLYHEHDATQVDAIDASLLDLRGRLTTALQHYRPTSHLVRDIQSQIHERELNRQKAFSDDHASTTRMGRSTAKDSMLTQRATSAADAAALRAKEAVLRQTLQQLDSELDLLDAAEATLAELERKKNVAEDAYNSTQHTLSEQGLTEAEDTQRLAKVRLVQPANIPTEPEPTKILILLAGFVIAVMAVIATALTRFAMNPLIFTAEGLAEITDLPILGTLEVDRRSSPVQ
jgi:uncharacterized protein involved in exopolysaccharide biosynthesis